MQAAATRTGSELLKNHAASMRARFVLEARRWEVLRDGDDFGNLDELLAIGISAARSGNLGRADQVRELFGRLAAGGGSPAIAPALTVMEREVAALVHLGAGRPNEAVDALRTAVEAERKLPTGMGPPRPIKPAGELLGEVLLEMGRAPEAREAFEQSLQRYPNRSASVLGTARSAVAAGDRTLAARHYDALLANWREADADLADLAEAQTKGDCHLFLVDTAEKGDCPLLSSSPRSWRCSRCAAGAGPRQRTQNCTSREAFAEAIRSVTTISSRYGPGEKSRSDNDCIGTSGCPFRRSNSGGSVAAPNV